VDDLPAEREDRLVAAVAAVHGRAARGRSLDEEELGVLRVVDLAVGQAPRQRVALERALAPRELARLPRRLPRSRSRDRLRDDPAGIRGVLLEEFGEPLVHRLPHETVHPRVSELRLRLALELWLGELDGDDRGEAFANVLAFEVVLFLLEQPLVARVLVER